MDCNRLTASTPQALYQLINAALEEERGSESKDRSHPDDLRSIEAAVNRRLNTADGLCLMFDRFDTVLDLFEPSPQPVVFSNLRALRDRFKYHLTYLTATRRPLDPLSELAELFFANTLWLGPLSESDARWNVRRYAQRRGLEWNEDTTAAILRLSGSYPSLLRAVCEAHAAGATLDLVNLSRHPAVIHRALEFWADHPTQAELRQSGVEAKPSVGSPRTPYFVDIAQLTAKEHLLWEYLRSYPDQVCKG